MGEEQTRGRGDTVRGRGSAWELGRMGEEQTRGRGEGELGRMGEEQTRGHGDAGNRRKCDVIANRMDCEAISSI